MEWWYPLLALAGICVCFVLSFLALMAGINFLDRHDEKKDRDHG